MSEKEKKKNEEIRIGFFQCHCGVNIAGSVDVKEVVEYAKKLPNVVVAKDHMFLCSDPGRNLVKEAIKKYNLNRVVSSHCTPSLHQETFRTVLKEAGLNPFFHENVNSREHASWVHYRDKKKATDKVKVLVAGGIERVKHHKPIGTMRLKVKKSVLVIGGGPAGIQAALDLGKAGYKVYLVDRRPHLGGNMARLGKVFPTDDCPICILGKKFHELRQVKEIEVITYAEVKELSGYVGNYKVKIEKKPRYVDEEKCIGCLTCVSRCPVRVKSEWYEGMDVRPAIYINYPAQFPRIPVRDPEACINCGVCKKVCPADAIDFDQKPETIELEVGAIIVATGYEEWKPYAIEEYGYGKYKNVITQLELAQMLNPEGPTHGKPFKPSDARYNKKKRKLVIEGEPPKKYVFIHCVGSRDEKYFSYCSKICCMYSIKHAKMILMDVDPNAEIYLCYMDIRAFSKGYEEYYKQVQKLGARIVRGKPAEIREDPKTKKLYVKVEDTLLGKPIEIEADLVVLASTLRPSKGTKELADILRITTGEDGFLRELHPKVGPVDTVTAGIFIAGAASGPKDIPESVAQGSAAAARAMSLLGKGEVEIILNKAEVNQELCIGCGICETLCPYGAIKVHETHLGRKAKVSEVECQGCGACAGGCPTGAVMRRNYELDQMFAQIEGILRSAKEIFKDEPIVLAFACKQCAYAASEAAGTSRLEYPPNVFIIRIPCSGTIDIAHVLKAFKEGADVVYVGGCEPGSCAFVDGNLKAEKRIQFAKRLLDAIGIGGDRLEIFWIPAPESMKFAEVAKMMVERAKKLGPTPLRKAKAVKEVI